MDLMILPDSGEGMNILLVAIVRQGFIRVYDAVKYTLFSTVYRN